MNLRTLMLGTLLATGAVLAAGCPGDPSDDTETTDDTDTDTAGIEGSDVFASNCQSCHGASGGGTGAGPDLSTRVPGLSVDDVKGIVRDGSGTMTGFTADQIPDDEVDAVAEYVVSEWGS